MDEEKSATDMISEMYETIKTMSKTLAIMDRNIKILNDKANGALFPNPTEIIAKLTPMQKTILDDLDEVSKVGVVQATASVLTAEPKVAYTQKQNIRVESKIVSIDKKPMHGIQIIVLNASDKIIKKTTSNRAGMWMCYLPPGKYTIKYEQLGTVIQQKSVELVEGQLELKI